jgi:hypothetical protein
MGSPPYPASSIALAEWATLRAHGSLTENKLAPDTIQSYLSAIRSIHIDRHLSLAVFEDEWLQRIIAGIRRATPYTEKKKAAPITPDILEKLCLPWDSSIRIDDINLDTAWKVAFAGFLRSGEFTYDDRADKFTLELTKLTRSDVTFGEGDEHVRLRLKRSKTDLLHHGVDIVIAATASLTCPVKALRRLFQLDPQPPTAPLFRLEGRSFNYSTVVLVLQNRLRNVGVNDPESYRGHSFRRGAAQHASSIGLPECDIQSLGRWSSQAFKAYFKTIHSQRFNLSFRFLTGHSVLLRPL